MIAAGIYAPAALAPATTTHDVRPLLDRQGQPVVAGVSEDGRLTVWHGSTIRWQGRLPQHLRMPLDLLVWLQNANR